MSISDNIKTSFYAGVGFMLKGKEKIEEAAKDFVKDQKLASEEGEKFIKEVMNKADETKADVEKFVDERIKNAVKKMGLMTKEDYDNLKKEYDSLKASYEELKKEIQTSKQE